MGSPDTPAASLRRNQLQLGVLEGGTNYGTTCMYQEAEDETAKLGSIYRWCLHTASLGPLSSSRTLWMAQWPFFCVSTIGRCS